MTEATKGMESMKTTDEILAGLEADGILKVLDRGLCCTACGADLDEGGHYHGCGNAGRYEGEEPTRPRPCDCIRCGYPHDGTSRYCVECVREERDRDRIDATEVAS